MGRAHLVWQRRDVEGFTDNHKRTARVYRSEGLAVRCRPRKRLTMLRVAQPVPRHANERWSMDFVRDTLANGRVFRAFTLVDDATREALAIHADFSLPAASVIAVLEAVIARRGQPHAIVCDNGPEFTGRAMLSWAHQRGILLAFIRPGKPTENAFVESFNGKLREQCLNLHWFLTIADAQHRLEAWRVFFNTERPHKSLGNLTPQQYADKKKTERQNEELTRLSATGLRLGGTSAH